MKRSLFSLLVALFLFSSCANDSPVEAVESAPVVEKDSIPTIEGEFIFLGDAAVLKGKNFIYGVEIDSLSRKLADSVDPLKKDEFHMIPVVVKGKIIQNPRQEGWEEVVQIKEIIKISTEMKDSAAPTVKHDLDKP